MNIIKQDYTKGNHDNITGAIHGLNIFCKNWCMNCGETKRTGEPTFRCSECNFNANPETGDCAIKNFAYSHEHSYPMEQFGSMGSL